MKLVHFFIYFVGDKRLIKCNQTYRSSNKKMEIRSDVLRLINSFFPVTTKGDAVVNPETGKEISCIINFYGRTGLLRNILVCLSEQDYSKNAFEVILVEDRNGTPEGKNIAEEFSGYLNIIYVPLERNFGFMGYSRNTGIENSTGRYLLFLDDDTVILQKDFLQLLVKEFSDTGADAILPRGSPSYCVARTRYQYHDPYFPTNRCVAYKRETISDMGGFISDIIGQEDVEFTARLILNSKKLHRSANLEYYHPPLLVQSRGKASAVGYSFARLRDRYPFIVWILLIINGCRYLPLGLFPFNEKYVNQSNFSLGFLKGFIYSFLGINAEYR